MNTLDKVAENVDPVAAARLAAAIVYKNDIVSIGTNKYKTHPLQQKYGTHEQSVYLHAEIDAIAKALRFLDLEELSNSTLYVTRLKYESAEQHPRKDKLHRGLACPCKGCTRAIAAFDIKRVCYSTEEGQEWL